VGTGYFIKSNSKIVIQKKSQTTPNEHSEQPSGTANFASAYIDHGITPTNKSYEYIIIPKTTNEALQSMDLDYYEILQQNDNAHIVKYKDTNIFNYVLFSSNINLPNDGVIISNDSPSMIIIKDNNTTMSLKLINPNYRSSQITNIVLKGKWNIANPQNTIQIIKQTELETQLKFTSIDGLGTTINLEYIGASYDASAPQVSDLNITKDSNTTLRANYTFTDPNNYNEEDSNISWYYKNIFGTEEMKQSNTSATYELPSSYVIGDFIKFSVMPQNSNNISGKPMMSNWISPDLPNKFSFTDKIKVEEEPSHKNSSLHFENKFYGLAVKIPGNSSDIYSFTHRMGLSFWSPPESNSTIGIYKLSNDKTKFTLLYQNNGHIEADDYKPYVNITKNVFVRGGDVILYGGLGNHDKAIRGSFKDEDKFAQFDSWNNFTNTGAYFSMNYNDGLPLEVNIDDITTNTSRPYGHYAYIRKVIFN
jgi:archaellin